MGEMYLPLLFSASALLICICSFFYFRSYLKRRTGQKRILAELEEEVNKILKSINETTYRDITLIEERGKKLKDLLAEVEKRMNVYFKEMETRQGAEQSYAALTAQAAQAALAAQEKKSAPSYEELGKNRYKLPTEELSDEIVASDTAASAEADAESNPAPADNTPSSIGSMGEQIRSLLHAGLSAAMIASRLGISISEVNFALALLERREDG